MADPFDPLKLYELAKELANRSNDEARLRTAVNRAYYSAFLIARGKARIIREKKRVHTEVIKDIKGQDSTAGSWLGALFRLRKVADYELVPVQSKDSDWLHNWSWALDTVEHLLPKLENL